MNNFIALTHDNNGKRVIIEIVTPETMQALKTRIKRDPSSTGCYGETLVFPRHSVTMKLAREYLGGETNENSNG